MIILINILLLLISTIVLIVKYIRINVKVLSRESIEKEARKRAKELIYEDPVITCDYCGTKIDTAVDKVCPNCGGSYSNDKEWQRRHAVDPEWEEKNIQELINQKLQEAQEKSANIKRRLKKAIISLSVIMALLIIFAIVSQISIMSRSYYAESEKLNNYSFEHYTAEDYTIDGDGIIVDEKDIKVALTGIYKDEEKETFKLEYSIKNSSKENLKVRFYRSGTNERAYNHIFYETIKSGDSVTLYDRIYDLTDPEISSLIFTGIQISTKEAVIYNREEYLRMKTTSTYVPVHQQPEGTVIYDQKNVKIVSSEDNEDGYHIWIDNRTDNDFLITSTELKVDGEKQNTTNIYKETLPAHHVYISSGIRVIGTDMSETKKAGEIQISIEFKCDDSPAEGFSTGYMNLK